MTIRSGTVAMIGRPNVGKSTLLNVLLGEKVSITSPKPQTTRWQILGIKTGNDSQIIFIDTPGMHQNEKSAMSRYLNRIALATMLDADVVIVVMDVLRFTKEDEMVLNKLKGIEKPVILVLNKIDLLKDKSALLPRIDHLKDQFPFTAIVPVSARARENLDLLEKEMIEHLPENPFLFPEDQVTDKSLRFQIAEIIREKIIEATEAEIPYTTTVQIESIKQDEKCTKINALIWVERKGQKIIIIGKKGERLKKIGTLARREIEKLLESKVYLQMWIKVKSDWTDDDKALQSLGYE
ncbi:MAG: GTPase Era [Gammaproteobacteria bacterium RIFCSPHIGHO2_12_FULL_38_14]|nr:MAG: GTPase Era [Gammaproteobacteria bacterium RIFCSPHIGHO2_12_FULL_38_14]